MPSRTVPSNVRKHFQSKYRKSQLFSRFQSELGLDIDANCSVAESLGIVTKNGKEKQLALSEFGVNSFRLAADLIDARQALRMFDVDELQSIMELLPRKSVAEIAPTKRFSKLIDELSRDYTRKQLESAIKRAIAAKKLPGCRQDQSMTIGPLGILRASESRYAALGGGIILLLETLVGLNKSESFLEYAKFVNKPFRFSSGSELAWEAFLQRVLVDGTDEQIVAVLNAMIDAGEIGVTVIQEMGWEYICTPHGTFELEWQPLLKELADLVVKSSDVKYLEITLEKEGLSNGTLDQRIVDFCILKNPHALWNFMSIGQMADISRELGLVRLDRLSHHDREPLWTAILARVGFSIPKRQGGLNEFREYLQDAKLELQAWQFKGEAEYMATKTVLDAVAKAERILKNVLYFHSTLLWRESIDSFEEELDELDEPRRTQRVLEITNNIIAKETDTSSEIRYRLRERKLSFSHITWLLRRINECVRKKTRKGKQLRTRVKKHLDKEEILNKRVLKLLDEIPRERNLFAHPPEKKPGIKNAIQLLVKLKELADLLESEKAYPELIMVKRKVKDEYGIEYYIIEDERGRTRPLWLDPDSETAGAYDLDTGRTYCASSIINPAYVNPFITEMFW